MPVEYGHGQKQYSEQDSSTVVQYTKWFVLHNYEYVIQYRAGMFTVHVYNIETKTTTKCDSAKTLEGAYHNAYCKLKKFDHTTK